MYALVTASCSRGEIVSIMRKLEAGSYACVSLLSCYRWVCVCVLCDFFGKGNLIDTGRGCSGCAA